MLADAGEQVSGGVPRGVSSNAPVNRRVSPSHPKASGTTAFCVLSSLQGLSAHFIEATRGGRRVRSLR